MRELNFDALLPISLALVASTSAKCQSGGNESHLEVVNSWQQSVKIALPDPKGVAASVIDGGSNPIGIKVFNDNIYMTIPRWSRGQRVPVNLGVTPKPVITSNWTRLTYSSSGSKAVLVFSEFLMSARSIRQPRNRIIFEASYF